MKIVAFMIAAASLLCASGSSIGSLPQEREMTAMVRDVLAMTGLHNEVIVVIDPEAKGCAYATTVSGAQYIGVDLKCTGRLKTRRKAYDWRAAGILCHEIGHLLNGHTTNEKEGNPAEETQADEWSGWAMYRLSATLDQAQTFMRTVSIDGGKTHPGRAIRIASVARGWNKARLGTRPAPPANGWDNWWGELMKKPLPWRPR